MTKPNDYYWSRTSALCGGRYEDICFLDENTGWAASNSGYVLYTDDGGDTWTKRGCFPSVPQENPNQHQPMYLRTIAMENDYEHGWVGTLSSQAVLWRTRDGGWNWENMSLPNPRLAMVCGMSLVNSKVLYLSGTNDPSNPAMVMKTIDGGKTWTSFDMSQYASLLVDIHFTDALNGFVVGGYSDQPDPAREDCRPVILHTTDGGNSWTDRLRGHEQFTIGEWGWKIFFLPEGRVGYIAIQSREKAVLAKTDNSGHTWHSAHIAQREKFANLQGVGFADERSGWAGGWGDDLEQRDSGYALGTNNDDESWKPAPRTGRFLNRFQFFGDPAVIGYASGHTIYKMTLNPRDDAPLNVENQYLQSSVDVPRFTDQVPIEFTVPDGCLRIDIHIWDFFGIHVRHLLAEADPVPGPRTVMWDGADDDGEEVANSRYIYRLSVDGDAESRIIAYHRS